VVGEVLRANGQLQQKLSLAEAQLQEQSAAIASHLNQAMTDELTDLPNRRAFDDQLRRRLEGHKKHNVPFSIMLIDIDFFKKVNDTYGHVAGDRVLCDIADVLRAAMRKHDLIARYGGEEFAALLPCTSLEDAVHGARCARQTVEAATARFEGLTIRVTASVGLTAVRPGDDVTAIVRRADDALYASKSGGRNCGHLHDGVACIRIPSAADAGGEVPAQDAPTKPDTVFDAWAVPGLSPELATACADLRGCADPHRGSVETG
jgi:diguanylate cyclase